MARFTSSILVVAVAVAAVLISIEQCQAFAPSPTTLSNIWTSTGLSMMTNEKDEPYSPITSRRNVLSGIATAFLATTAACVSAPQAASAKYSDYARREKDWDERISKGEIKVSSARDLRAQLQEIAPMNSEGSKIFCPNGPSANVSPLMENKCGDRLATPSVYGRTTDSMGNSIPGFTGGSSSSRDGSWSPGGSSSVSAVAGGFPTYKENEWKIRQ